MCKAGSIIDLWDGFEKGGDDQRHATKKCSEEKKIFIDVDNYLFYNYSPHDKLHIRDKKLFLNDNKYNVCIISSPGNFDIGSILKKLEYKNVPIVKRESDIVRRLKTYLPIFIPEIILISVIIAIFYYGGGVTSLLPYFLSLILIFSFVNFYLKTIYLPISNNRKALYTAIYFLHNLLTCGVLYILIALLNDMIHNRCNLKLFLFINLYLIIVIFIFFIYKRCILSIWEEKVSGAEIRTNRVCCYLNEYM
tara:strand:- start:2209 stop:2958 length:750 start_codon:yes stop_codon:yes gene_type:complete